MTEFDSVKLAVEAIRYKDDISYIRDLLCAFRIPSTTVARVVDALGQGSGMRSAKLYKRAVVTVGDSLVNDAQQDELTEHSADFQVHLFVSSGQVAVFDHETASAVTFHADKSAENLHLLLKLAGTGKVIFPSDPRGVAELSAELYNVLTGVELANDESASAIFVINLNYLSFMISRFGDKNLKDIFSRANAFNETNFNKVLEGLLKALTSEGRSGFALNSIEGFSFLRNSFVDIPRLSYAAATLAIRILDFDLKNVDAEALSSLLYRVINRDEKGLYGYKTSLTNANKVLGPVYFNKLKAQIEDAAGDIDKLQAALEDLESVFFFDPTDGPGSFLSLAISNAFELASLIREESDGRVCPRITPGQFIGTASNELTGRAAHMCLFSTFIQAMSVSDSVDLDAAGRIFASVKIVICDQLSTPWASICPNNGRTVIVGCPVFEGFKKLSDDEKQRLKRIFANSSCGDVDYSSAWLVLSARYILDTKSRAALVLTNSICQGVQVSQIWPLVFEHEVGINFAHTSFKWKNGPDQSSAVTVVIVGLAAGNACNVNRIYTGDREVVTDVIGPYLTSGNRLIIKKRKTRLAAFLPPMVKGNMPYDNGYLLLTSQEKDSICNEYPASAVLFKKALGSKEFIRREPRWCLWVTDDLFDLAKSVPPVAARISSVKAWRQDNDDPAVIKLAERPHQFRETNQTRKSSLIIPSVSSERRAYIPIGFVGPDTIITNLAFAIYDCEPWVMGMLSSRMHMSWIRTVCGSLETRLRYSNELGYNTFSFPEITEEQKGVLKRFVYDIISCRENYPDLDLGKLYTEMPADLEDLHRELDLFVDSCYSPTPFESDVDRVALLFNLYRQ
jgi:hypothetical protein